MDERATAVGLAVMEHGGSAADAAIAANAVLAVTCQHMCGLGGDLFALVHTGTGPPEVLNASGRAGSGASAAALRAEGHHQVPQRGHMAAVTVPGCVDGWLALHARHGRLPLGELLSPAIELAADGFVPSGLLVLASTLLDDIPGATELAGLEADRLVRRPGLADTLRQVATGGRDSFYRGAFGQMLVALGAGQFTDTDLTRSHAEWVDPLGLPLHDRLVWTVPPNSQGYLTLAGAGIAERVGWPDRETALWAHVGIESARAAAHDRPRVLHDEADGAELVADDRLAERAARIRPDRSVPWADRYDEGGTMYLCAADDRGMAVSLIQSNARDFGSLLVAGDTGVFLHNRGLGFSLVPGHPAELAPGRRPPHTLAPALVTDLDGDLVAVLGTMGGDAQPQVMLQLLARLLVGDLPPGECVGAPRWVLASPDPRSGFDTWSSGGRVQVHLEGDAPADWRPGLVERGHLVAQFDHPTAYGHAHMIVRTDQGWAGAADPRAQGLAAGL
ncbi:MAG: gamma-glutamyltransferase family protein [Acidimicrobiia bacterium]|nr:gamma-glutamyltransferase family protein [Acidimicrobiia bacterium]